MNIKLLALLKINWIKVEIKQKKKIKKLIKKILMTKKMV